MACGEAGVGEGGGEGRGRFQIKWNVQYVRRHLNSLLSFNSLPDALNWLVTRP